MAVTGTFKHGLPMQPHLQLMNSANALVVKRVFVLILAMAGFLLTSLVRSGRKAFNT